MSHTSAPTSGSRSSAGGSGSSQRSPQLSSPPGTPGVQVRPRVQHPPADPPDPGAGRPGDAEVYVGGDEAGVAGVVDQPEELPGLDPHPGRDAGRDRQQVGTVVADPVVAH